MTLELSVIVSP